jgi:hypothetical protein
LLVPLISWIAPANRDDSVFLEPSLHYCARHLAWTPDIVVGDMAYVNLHAQRRLREDLHVALVTKLKPNMTLPEAFDDAHTMTCEQGQVLREAVRKLRAMVELARRAGKNFPVSGFGLSVPLIGSHGVRRRYGCSRKR